MHILIHKARWSGCDLSEMSNDLVYYDTNIWIAWMRGKSDKFFPQAKKLVDEVLSGKKIAVMSQLVLLETIHALRQKIAQNSPYDNRNTNKHDIQTQINKTVQQFLNSVRIMVEDGHVIILNPSASVASHHNRVLQKSVKYFGYLRIIGICPYCENGWVGRHASNTCGHCGHTKNSIKKYNYKGLGHADLEHAFFALSGHATEFYSADKSFMDLKNDSDFDNISFRIVT